MPKKFVGPPGASVYVPGSSFPIIVGEDGLVELDEKDRIKVAERAAILEASSEPEEEPEEESAEESAEEEEEDSEASPKKKVVVKKK